MFKKGILWVGLFVFVMSGQILLTQVGAADQNKGAAKITLDGGERGNIHFPHREHQEALKDCNACHDLFPQKKGAIDEFKAQGKLKKKQVMNKKCIACHKHNKQKGLKAGPTICSQCHIR